MAHVQLLHWKESEGLERVRELRGSGHQVQYEAEARAALALLKEEPVQAIVIDCTRLPSHGRAVAHALRQRKSSRFTPLVIVATGHVPLMQHRVHGDPPSGRISDPRSPRPARVRGAHSERRAVIGFICAARRAG